MLLEQGRQYRAELDLPWPRKAWFGKAKSTLQDAGFTEVDVYDADGKSCAQGRWTGQTGEVDLSAYPRIVRVWPL